MAYKIVAIFVILVSWSTLLYASSQGCQGGQDVPKSDYGSLMGQIQKKVTHPFSINDITCFKVTNGFGSDKNYCVELNIPLENGKMTCTAKWGNGRGSASSSVCSNNGASVVNGSGSNGLHIGGGNAGVGNAVHSMKDKFSKIFHHGFPFNK